MSNLFNSNGELNANGLQQTLQELAKYAAILEAIEHKEELFKEIINNQTETNNAVIKAVENNQDISEEELIVILNSFSAQKAKQIREKLNEIIVKEIIE